MTKISDEIQQQRRKKIVALYTEDSIGIKALSDRFHTTSSTILKWLKEEGVYTPRKPGRPGIEGGLLKGYKQRSKHIFND